MKSGFRKIAAVLCAAVMAGAFIFSFPVTAEAKTDYSPIFNIDWYLYYNPDVLAETKATGDINFPLHHFLEYGMKEGRRATQDFNVYSYAVRYPDLVAAFGGKLELYYYHYLEHGLAEGRSGAGEETVVDFPVPVVPVSGYQIQANIPQEALTWQSPAAAKETKTMRRVAQQAASKSDYCLIVDRSLNRVGIYRGNSGAREPVRVVYCATGVNNATPTGQYYLGGRGRSFSGDNYTCYYFTSFIGSKYLFHSVLYKKDTMEILNGKLGKQLSHGCIRLNIDDAKWIFSYLPAGTGVVIY